MAKRIGNLPKSESKFWEHADTNQHLIKEQKCNHSFEPVTSTDWECRKCGAGLTAYGSRGLQIVEALSAQEAEH